MGLEVRPLDPLQPNTAYTATVQGVQNASGVPMVGVHTRHFTTRGGASVDSVMPVETSYYTFGSQRVALRISGDPDPDRNGLYYIHTDHPSTSLRTSLGSTSALSYGQGHAQEGEEVPGSRARHLPFGEYRVEPEAGLSDRGFTGHRELGGIGLVHMRARLYSPELGRFVSPDILIPDPADPQSLNRFGYVNNNPLRFVDPTGHLIESNGGGGHPPEEPPEQPPADPVGYLAWLDASIRWYLYHPPDYASCPNCITVPALMEERAQVAMWVGAYGPEEGTLLDQITQFFEQNPEALVPIGLVIGGGAADELAGFRIQAGNRYLVDGMQLSVDEALATAVDFLGEGYRALANNRYVSADGLRQVRMADADIMGLHGRLPHMNFEGWQPIPGMPGMSERLYNLHIYLTDP